MHTTAVPWGHVRKIYQGDNAALQADGRADVGGDRQEAHIDRHDMRRHESAGQHTPPRESGGLCMVRSPRAGPDNPGQGAQRERAG